MKEYYESLDMLENKKVNDSAKVKLNEIKENEIAFAEFRRAHSLGEVKQDKEWEEKALAAMNKVLLEELEKKRQSRMPHVIVPDLPLELKIEDKEGNGVYRLFCYKNQADDAIKALRRKAFTARTFTYDIKAWQKENEDRAELQVRVKTSTKTLEESAGGAF